MSSINVDYNFKTDDDGVSNNTFQNSIKYFQNNSTTFNKFKGIVWSHKLNNKYAKYQDRHPYAENFVRQAYREDCAVLGPIPLQNHGLQSVCQGRCPNYSPIRPCAISANSASSCQTQESSGTLVGGRNGHHLVWKHNLSKFRWSDAESSSIHATRYLAE